MQHILTFATLHCRQLQTQSYEHHSSSHTHRGHVAFTVSAVLEGNLDVPSSCVQIDECRVAHFSTPESESSLRVLSVYVYIYIL